MDQNSQPRTDGFRAYYPLEEDDAFEREYVVHGDGEYVNGEVYVNICESHGRTSEPWPSPYRGVSKDKLTWYLRVFQLRRELFTQPGRKALKHAVRAALWDQQCATKRSGTEQAQL